MTGHVDVHHEPVLAESVCRLLVTGGGWYVDATVGHGGHAARLLALRADIQVLGLDQDPAALARAAETLRPYGDRVQLVRGNFRHLADWVPERCRPVAGVLFDLGVSSAQLDDPARGFTYQVDAPLDMRMDPDGERTAFRAVNMMSAQELAEVLRTYGEERWASRVAQFIVESRRREPIRTTGQLVDVIKAAIPASARRTGGHPARRTFQALRIWVNQELEALEEGLGAARPLVRPGGRIAVLTFHSLEDRLVKQRFRTWASADQGRLVTKKPVIPTDDEVRANPRSRSAKLRVFEV
jgi:16S rRNA (cytosine1402-N4)-methyltransferase